ncbi:hypothetical protein BN982_04102 [Halobacillus karajensis]|nr:hypothetical protein BN982_04102 [Halobacillus karajensis]
MGKSHPISVRLNDQTHNRLNKIKELIKQSEGYEPSHADLFHQMITLYHKHLTSVDHEALSKIERDALIKALVKEKP